MMQYPYIDGDDLISKFIFKWINHNNSSHFWAFTLCQVHNDIHYLWNICAKHFKYITSLKPYKTKDRSYYCLHITAKSLDKSTVLLKVIQVVSDHLSLSLSVWRQNPCTFPAIYFQICSEEEEGVYSCPDENDEQWTWGRDRVRKEIEGRFLTCGRQTWPSWAGTITFPLWEEGKPQSSWGTHPSGPGN